MREDYWRPNKKKVNKFLFKKKERQEKRRRNQVQAKRDKKINKKFKQRIFFL